MTPFVIGIIVIICLLLLIIIRTPSTGDRYIILPKRAEGSLKKMRTLSESPNNTILVGKAMALYEMVLDAQVEGGQIVVKKANGEEEGFVIT